MILILSKTFKPQDKDVSYGYNIKLNVNLLNVSSLFT